MTYDSMWKSTSMHLIEFKSAKYFEKRHYCTLLPLKQPSAQPTLKQV